MSLLILTEASIPEVNLIRICFNILLIQIKFFILTEINSFTPTTITSKQNILVASCFEGFCCAALNCSLKVI
ncbi:hypothetical protein T4B_11738 [Trichinella pseudospiralis]|uniref:Uncharacterized protein n=1 Tax=Trichinella pseudospiralis TaxID=6337 RepID=A0A0V1ITH9_TRIPS|nr:hypothetical protein T4B_11738 [Trichinella pseudospiralis]